MMDFDGLQSEASDFGAQQSYLTRLLPSYDAAEAIEEIYLEEAKALLLQDLQVALGLLPSDTEDMAVIDEIVDLQEPRLRRALAIKQLALVFEDQNAGESSKTWLYWKEYTRLYENERAGF